MLFMKSTISHAYVHSISSAYNIIPVGFWRAGFHVRYSAQAICSEAAGSPPVSPPSLLSEWLVFAWLHLFREREGGKREGERGSESISTMIAKHFTHAHKCSARCKQ